jgi:hypothetical protein
VFCASTAFLFFIFNFQPVMAESGLIKVDRSSGNLLRYTNTTYAITLLYPSNWNIYPGQNAPNSTIIDIVDISPLTNNQNGANATNLQIGIDNSVPANITSEQYLSNLVNNNKDNFKDYKVISIDNSTKVSGKPAFSVIGTYKDNTSGIPLGSMDTSSKIGEHVYYAHFVTGASGFSALLPTVQQIIDSLEVNHPGNITEPNAVLKSNTTSTSVTSNNSSPNPIFPFNKVTSSAENTTNGSNLSTYENSTWGIAFQYPSNWKTIPGKRAEGFLIDAVALLAPQKSLSAGFPAGVVVQLNEPPILPHMTLEKYTEAHLNEINKMSKGNHFVLIGSGPTTFAGNDGYKVAFTMDRSLPGGGSQTFKTVQVWTVQDDKAYLVTYTAQSEDYLTYLNTAQNIVDSFKITPTKPSTSLHSTVPATSGGNENNSSANGSSNHDHTSKHTDHHNSKHNKTSSNPGGSKSSGQATASQASASPTTINPQ